MALYEQALTGHDLDTEATNDPVEFTMSGPGTSEPSIGLASTGDNTAIFSWDTDNIISPVDTNITFTCTDMYGAEVKQTVNMVSWFEPYVQPVDPIVRNTGVLYTGTVYATTQEAGLSLALSYTFAGADEPAGFDFVDNNDNTATITWTPSGLTIDTNFDVTAVDDGLLTLEYTRNILISSNDIPPLLDVISDVYGGMSSYIVAISNGDFEFDAEVRSSSVGNDNITGWTVTAGTMNVVDESDILHLSIVNAGAEMGNMTGWNAGTGLYYTSASGSSEPHTGTYYFHGGVVGQTGECEMFSDPIDVSAYATDIDLGTVPITLDYWQLSFESNNDPGRGMLRYYSDVAGTSLISSDNNAFYNGPSNIWENRSDTYIIPATTRSIRIVGQCNIIGLNFASAYFDDWQLYLTIISEAIIISEDALPVIGFGDVVSIDGDTAVVSAIKDDTTETDAGAIYVFVRTAGVWNQQQKILGDNDLFGSAVDISGDTIVVGSRYVPGENVISGEVKIYTRIGTVWSEQQTLIPPTQVYFFGYAVAVKGDDLIIGATRHALAGQRDKGQAYVYTRTGTVWSLEQSVIGDDLVDYDSYGASVAIDTDVVIIGSDTYYTNTDAYGAIYVFTRSGGTWTQQQKLSATVPQIDAMMGLTLGISGDYIVAGSGFYDDTYSNQGCFYVFKNNVGTWEQHQQIFASDAAGDDEYFGGCVSIDGGVIAAKSNVVHTGQYIYKYTLIGETWGSEIKYIPELDGNGDPPKQASSSVIWTVSVSGTTVLGGFSGYANDSLINVGMATTFEDFSYQNYIMDAGTIATSTGVSDPVTILANIEDIDAGTVTMVVSGDQSSRSVTDSGKFGVQFYDAAGDPIGTPYYNSDLITEIGFWTTRYANISTVSGARTAAVAWAATGDGTGDNDVLFDNFSITIE